MKKKPIIVVLGMHRSGTSAIARGLEILGVSLGSNLIPGNFDNEKGFWEDEDLVELNESIQEILGYQWYGTELNSPMDWSNEQLQKKKEEARALITDKASQTELFGFKDPRTAINIEFWLKVFDEADLEPRFIISFRNPIDVAMSLEARNGLPITKSLYLWGNSLLRSLRYTSGSKRIVVSLEKLLESPEQEIERISNALAIPLTDDRSLISEYIDEFLDKSLRHQKGNIEEQRDTLSNHSYLLELLDLADALSSDDETFDSEAFPERIKLLELQFAAIYSLLELYVDSDQKMMAAQISSKSTQAHLQDISESLSVAKSQIIEQQNSLNEKDSAITALQHEKDSAITALQHKYTALDDHRIALESSFSWKVTAPMRIAIHVFLTIPWNFIRKSSARITQFFWDFLPADGSFKRNAKKRIFTTFQFPLKYTGFYREWIEFEEALAKAGQDVLPDADQSAFDIELRHRKFEDKQFDTPPTSAHVKLITFYLPQFHQIPENDEWWGEGFTEWTNVKPATPSYEGHYQPHVPLALGYYDLADSNIMKKQVELAEVFGIGGFCFYFYWFSGTRLLEKPILNLLADKEINFPFCLCWANENWSRTWDGKDNELLIAQHHTPEDDIEFISYLAQYLLDERYIRVDGKPLIMVYRPSLLPDPIETTHRWRNWCNSNGIGEIYLVTTHSFEAVDPAVYGFDAAVEFPPNNTAPAVITEHTPGATDDFEGIVYDWGSIASRSKHYSKPEYTLFRGVNPSWDNTARRKNRGAIFAGSNPPQYQRWLGNAINDTLDRFSDPSKRLVFINAWNEWAEGAHLEPDQAYGYAYLNATRKALESSDVDRQKLPRRVLLVAHDAHPHGAQNLALHIAKYLSEDFGFQVDMVVLGDGPLLEQYRKYAQVYSLAGKDPEGNQAKLLALQLLEYGHTSAICNTTVTGLFGTVLKQIGLHVVTLIHELPDVIRNNQLEGHVRSIAQNSNKIVFPANAVTDGFRQFSDVDNEKVVLRPQGTYKRNEYRSEAQRQQARTALRNRFNIPAEQQIVLCAGYADRRKGIDLFVDMALEVLQTLSRVTFIWLGHWDTSIEADIKRRVDESDYSNHFIFPGLDYETDIYFAGSDLYALMSREDPFPSVVMEALDVAVPVIAFQGAGGFSELQQGCGVLVTHCDTSAFAQQVSRLLTDGRIREELGGTGEDIIRHQFSFRHYLFDLLSLAQIDIARVSVVVPNYNYAHYLKERIQSILNQTYPIYELIILDDYSTVQT
jgi:glycosyltransferase involved in cell wall biosynthesis